jgi:hypothetical protein
MGGVRKSHAVIVTKGTNVFLIFACMTLKSVHKKNCH